MSHGRSGKDPFIARNFVISTCLNFRLLTAYFQITSAFRKDLLFLNLTRRQKVVSSQSGEKNVRIVSVLEGNVVAVIAENDVCPLF